MYSCYVLSLYLRLSEAGNLTLPPGPEDFKSQLQSTGGGGWGLAASDVI